MENLWGNPLHVGEPTKLDYKVGGVSKLPSLWENQPIGKEL